MYECVCVCVCVCVCLCVCVSVCLCVCVDFVFVVFAMVSGLCQIMNKTLARLSRHKHSNFENTCQECELSWETRGQR